VSLSERKLSAWAMVMGVRLPSDYPESRIRRRGGLPDVDFSGASPDPGYRSPLQRLSDRIASALRSLRDWRAPVTTVAGAVAEDIGESARTPYIERSGRPWKASPIKPVRRRPNTMKVNRFAALHEPTLQHDPGLIRIYAVTYCFYELTSRMAQLFGRGTKQRMNDVSLV